MECPDCGRKMVDNGSCWYCDSCGIDVGKETESSDFPESLSELEYDRYLI